MPEILETDASLTLIKPVNSEKTTKTAQSRAHFRAYIILPLFKFRTLESTFGDDKTVFAVAPERQIVVNYSVFLSSAFATALYKNNLKLLQLMCRSHHSCNWTPKFIGRGIKKGDE